MDPDDVAHKRQLLGELKRRKQLREEQLAELGISADPSIHMEIEDLTQQMDALRQDLNANDRPDQLAPARRMSDWSPGDKIGIPDQQRNVFAQTAQIYRAYLQLHVVIYAALGAAYWLGAYAAVLGAAIGGLLRGLIGAYALALAGAIIGFAIGAVFDPASPQRVRHVLAFVGRKLVIDAVVGAVSGVLIGGVVDGASGLNTGALWGALLGMLVGAILAGALVYNEHR